MQTWGRQKFIERTQGSDSSTTTIQREEQEKTTERGEGEESPKPNWVEKISTWLTS